MDSLSAGEDTRLVALRLLANGTEARGVTFDLGAADACRWAAHHLNGSSDFGSVARAGTAAMCAKDGTLSRFHYDGRGQLRVLGEIAAGDHCLWYRNFLLTEHPFGSDGPVLQAFCDQNQGTILVSTVSRKEGERMIASEPSGDLKTCQSISRTINAYVTPRVGRRPTIVALCNSDSRLLSWSLDLRGNATARDSTQYQSLSQCEDAADRLMPP